MALGLRGENPIWLLDDLTGNLFDDTFYMYVLQNVLPYVPATVYHDPDLLIPWTQPIQFLANGTLPVNIFFESEIVYRLEFRQNTGSLPPSQSDALIYEVNDYTAGAGGSTPIDNVSFSTGNQVTNPQFSLINFTSSLAISATNPAPTDIAPGWSFVAAGTGTATITKVPLDSTNTNPSNAPYALRLTLTGWTAGSVFLKQRFQQNGMLWAGEYVSSAITARLDGSPQAISARLIDSNSAVLGVVLPSTVVNESWNEFTGHALLPATTNPDVPPAAYIEYSLTLPSNIDIYLTSFQLVAQDLPLEPKFEQESIDRQIDHTFHYYKPQLEYKPIPSYTIGWDFSFNPGQALGSTIAATALGANKSRYIADQTISFEAVSNVLSYSLSNAGLAVFTSSNSAFAIVQYFDAKTARELLRQKLCAQLSASVSSGTLVGTISMYWTTDASLPDISTGTENSLVATMASGKPATFNGNWSKVLRGELGEATFSLTSTGTTFDLSEFDARADAAIDTATFFAIVIGFNTMTSAQDIAIDYCSLNGGDIPTRPAPLTKAQTLFELQHYYEKSYNETDVPATVEGQNSLLVLQVAQINGANVELLTKPFNLPWKTLKRTTPNFSLYSPDTGLADTVRGFVYTNGIVRNEADISLSTNWSIGTTPTAIGSKNMYFVPTNGNAQNAVAYVSTAAPFGYLTFHYVADARLGIV